MKIIYYLLCPVGLKSSEIDCQMICWKSKIFFTSDRDHNYLSQELQTAVVLSSAPFIGIRGTRAKKDF